jgi:hypothetical protein
MERGGHSGNTRQPRREGSDCVFIVLLSFAWSFIRLVVLLSFCPFFFGSWTGACEATCSGSTGGLFMADMTPGDAHGSASVSGFRPLGANESREHCLRRVPYFRAMGATLAEIMKATDWLAAVGP